MGIFASSLIEDVKERTRPRRAAFVVFGGAIDVAALETLDRMDGAWREVPGC